MRIISGIHKSKRIFAPKNLPVRPTTDMAKEALFNILNNQYYFDEISVLDLFTGIGSISLEFASRGTKQVIGVDKHPECIQFLNKINDELDCSIQFIKSDVYSYLKRIDQKFDVIFADPPYDFEIKKIQNIISLVFDNNLLENDGLLIVEHSNKTNLSNNDHFEYLKKYGGNMFSFFKNNSKNNLNKGPSLSNS